MNSRPLLWSVTSPGRNEPCACGSGKKYKLCCGRLSAPTEDPRMRLAAHLADGHYSDLESGAREVIRVDPLAGFAWQLLGIAVAKQGKDSVPAWERAVQLSPDDAVAQLNLGNALARLGRLADAQRSYERSLQLNPQFAEACLNAAAVHLQLGDFERAAQRSREAIRIKPDFAEAHQTLAVALGMLGQFDESVASGRRVLSIDPDMSEAHNTIGNALSKLNCHDEALVCFRRALMLNPNFAEAHANLANALRRSGNLGEAIEAYHRALLANPLFVAALTGLATAYRLQLRAPDAEAACRRALQIQPLCIEALVVLAELRADAGLFLEAETLFAHALSTDPGSSEALVGIARSRRMTSSDGAWLTAARSMVEGGLAPLREMSLRYAMGKYFDDLADFDSAFLNFRRANILAKCSGPVHDRTVISRTVDLIINSHGKAWFKRDQSSSNPSRRPVFIVGMLRSGTTLAEQILASHPSVHGAGELTYWGDKTACCIQGAFAEGTATLQVDSDTLSRLSSGYVELLHDLAPDAERVVDKLPTNFLLLGFIHAALPSARIIHLSRDPVDTCLSIYFQHFEAANTYVNDLDDLAHYYLEYRRLMQHWRGALPEKCLLEVSYEDLVLDLQAETRRILEFIELPWDPRCLDFHHTQRSVVTASKWQVRQKLHASSVNRWRGYAEHLGPLRSLWEQT